MSNQEQSFLFTAYGKNQRANISDADKKTLYKLIKLIVETYKGDTNE